MRLARSLQLHSLDGVVHQFWRCHNREHYLKAPKIKALYFQTIKEALKSHNKEESLRIQAYTCMDNHFHNLIHYRQGSPKLSAFLRQSHSLFGARYNRRYNRSGKVAESRPKTSLIENTEHVMRVHFYIEANPIRAGKSTLKQLRSYKYSSYRFYAYGIKDEFTLILTVPDWYLELGSSPRERQHRYRSLFLEYLGKALDRTEFFAPFIGSALWRLRSVQTVIRRREQVGRVKDSPS